MDNWNRTLAKEIAKGIVKTGIEGPFDTVVKSTAYDYPSIGCSCWEGNRADELLRAIPGGEEFIGRSYIDIKASGELPSTYFLHKSYVSVPGVFTAMPSAIVLT